MKTMVAHRRPDVTFFQPETFEEAISLLETPSRSLALQWLREHVDDDRAFRIYTVETLSDLKKWAVYHGKR